MYFIYNTAGIRSVSSDGGESRLEFDERGRGCLIDVWGWTIWGGKLVYIDCQDHKIEMYDFETGETRELADVFTKETLWVSGLDISPDGQWITYTRLDGAGSDLMLIEPFE